MQTLYQAMKNIKEIRGQTDNNLKTSVMHSLKWQGEEKKKKYQWQKVIVATLGWPVLFRDKIYRNVWTFHYRAVWLYVWTNIGWEMALCMHLSTSAFSTYMHTMVAYERSSFFPFIVLFYFSATNWPVWLYVILLLHTSREDISAVRFNSCGIHFGLPSVPALFSSSFFSQSHTSFWCRQYTRSNPNIFYQQHMCSIQIEI